MANATMSDREAIEVAYVHVAEALEALVILLEDLGLYEGAAAVEAADRALPVPAMLYRGRDG